MKSFIVETWKFVLGQRDHPVYRHEVEGWSYVRFWRGLRRGCLPLLVLVLGGASLCCGAVALLNVQNPPALPDDLLLVAFSALIGLSVGGEIIRWLTGLLATILAATTISAEIEAETFGLLRLTTIPTRQIVLAKFGASFRQFRLPLLVVAAARGIFALGMALTVGLLAATEAPLASLPTILRTLPPLPVLQGTLYAAATVAVVLAVLVWFLYYLISPVLSTFMFAALGVLASSLARTRAGGLTLAAGVRVALWGLGYVLGQLGLVLVSLMTLPVMAMPQAPIWLSQIVTADPATLVLGGALMAIVWALFLAAGQIALGLSLLYATTRRAARLPRP